MGFTPVDESEIATSAPSFNFTPISDDDIATTPEPSTYDRAMGALKGIARAGTDVVMAPADLVYRAGNELADLILGEDKDLTGTYPSDLRNEALDAISGGQGSKQSEEGVQLLGNLATVIGMPSQAKNIAAKVPLLGKASETSNIANLLSKTIGIGTEGAGYTALFNAKSDTLGKDMLEGGAVNVAANAVLGTAGKIAKGLSSKLSNAADATLEKGLGIQYGDRTKGLNRVNLYVDEAGEVVPFDKLDDAVGIQAPIQQQVKTLEDAGILANAPNDAQALKIHIAKAQKEVGKAIPALARDADEVLGNKEILPDFESTYKFLQGYRDTTRTGLMKEFDSILDDYVNTPGTGLQKLNKFTDQLQKETSFDSAIPAAQTKLKRMISYDLRKAAEREFDAALPARAGEFAKANSIYSAAENIGKTLNKPLARKSPSLGDYLTGGSLPMTVATGALFPALGIAPAAAISGTRLLGKAVQQYSEAAYPVSTSKLYKGLSNKAAIAGKITDAVTPAAKVFAAGVDNSQSLSPGAQGKIPQEQKERLKLSQEIQVRPSLQNTSNPSTNQDYSFMNTLFKGDNMKPEQVIEEIKKNPVDYAIAMMESGKKNKQTGDIVLDPKAKNPTSTASGLYQLIKSTAGKLGVKDVFNPEENYKGYLKLKEDTINKFDLDPNDYRMIYASHYLGETAFRKWLNGDPLTKTQREQVEYLQSELLPRLDAYYQKAVKHNSGVVEA